MSFSPVAASQHITEKYLRYLRTIFALDDTDYNKQFHSLLDERGKLAAGPFLETAYSFEKGCSLEDMIREGTIAKSFRKVHFPLTRPLYKHQEIAIRKILAGKNTIVSTGTGSGKTESFLIPILNHIAGEYEQGTLSDGVRALLIYPMNALANDQIERLRELLSDFPAIRYGCYTGQTQEKFTDALAEYKQLNDGHVPAPNELISREQMKETPPHILITNYAMLEYLMVRPKDSVFFDAAHAGSWKFIVLDEAHTYNGSSGIEVAMLLRRLKATLGSAQMTYILTSATLGDEDSNSEVAEFGENLCSSHFDVSDIVRAFRTVPQPVRDSRRLPRSFYVNLSKLYDAGNHKEIDRILDEFSAASSSDSDSEKLYDIILHDTNYTEIRYHLSDPMTIQQLAKEVHWTIDELSSFVAVATKAEKNGVRLFDARYHMFLRATESVFVTLPPSKKLFLDRTKTYYESDGTAYKVFEAAVCNTCHAVYLVGKVEGDYLEQSSYQSEDELRSVFLLKSEYSDTDEDHSLESEEMEAEEYELCARCGFLRKANAVNKCCCEHGNSHMVKVIRVKTRERTGTLTKCVVCENTNANGMLRMFFTGQEAVTSVLGTALFEELPAYRTEVETVFEDDDTGFGCEEFTVENRINEAKQFIAFSDSRQAAAFYATYFDQTYRSILYKRLIIETLSENRARWTAGGVSIPNFVSALAGQFEKYSILRPGEGESDKEAWKAILRETSDINGTTSMFSKGLIAFTLNPQHIPENKRLGLSQEEVCSLCNVLVQGMMTDAAIAYECTMQKADREFFAYNGIEYTYTLSDSDARQYRRSFIPRAEGRKNKRSDYFQRVMGRMGRQLGIDEINKYLSAIWSLLQRNYLIGKEGSCKLDSRQIQVIQPKRWYMCSKCRRLTPYNIHGVCPSYQCTGELAEIDVEEVLGDNHYYRLYQALDIRRMSIVEHTAQLSRDCAFEYQKKFKNKEIDILSCSTTFEMGVDVGSLETVFMRDMPPSPANYAQRAGRAGRSKQSAAFALTFCTKSSHDFSYFTDPVAMIRGKITPPKFVIENEKIAIRHVYASALSYFWKRYPQYFSTTVKMTEPSEDGISGIDAFKAYLNGKPKDLQDFLKRFLPSSLCRAGKFGIDEYEWLEGLFSTSSENPGVLTKAQREYLYEVDMLREGRKKLIEQNRPSDYLMQRIKVYQTESALSFFSRKNVMPKYGFPVDTVELNVTSQGATKLGLQLQRDLSLAISEYAPGSQVVANGKLITSRYIRKVPTMSWKMYDYVRCPTCKTLNIAPHVDPQDPDSLQSCHQCDAPFEGREGTFIIPSFGFAADGEKIEQPSLKKPDRTYRGEVSYIGYRAKFDTSTYFFSGTSVEITISSNDEMAVLNDSNFFVCHSCGYTDLDPKAFASSKTLKHKTSAGYPCSSERLRKYALGYRFETDVVQMRFHCPEVTDAATGLSLLYGILRGICRCLDIDEDDISGCIQYFRSEVSQMPNFALIFYDRTPGGAGHVKRLNDQTTLDRVLRKTLDLMKSCSCGGETGDSSCYSCLRSYYNQKHHDILRRGVVIEFLKQFLD